MAGIRAIGAVALPVIASAAAPAAPRDRVSNGQDDTEHATDNGNDAGQGSGTTGGHQHVEFRTSWAAHHVLRHTFGRKRMHHPIVGDLELVFDSMSLAADSSLELTVYTAEPDSPSADALTLLGHWEPPGCNTARQSDRGAVAHPEA